MSLQTRLLVAVGVLALAAVAAVALAVRQSARLGFRRFQDIERRIASDAVGQRAPALARQLDGSCCDGSTLDAAAAALPASFVALVVDARDASFIAAAGQPAHGLATIATRRDGAVLTIDATTRTGAFVERIRLKFLQRGEPIRLSDGRAAQLYVLPFPDQSQERQAAEFLGSLDRRLLVVTTAVGVLALVVTWTVARNTVRPIAELRAATRDLARGALSRRVEPRGTDEVVELARAFNAMAADLERQHALRQGLLHDVAHELRTPLTALRCRVESVLDGLSADPVGAMADVRDEAAHLERLVDDLQELALAEARELRLHVVEVRLAEVVSSAVRAAGLENDPRLRVDVPDAIVARGDAVRVRQIVLNLLTNADRYTPVDGMINVRGSIEGAEVRVEVENSGSHLDDEQLARLFDRFYRTDPSRQRASGGTGLGLAVVKHLVEAQGGRVWARSDASTVTVGFALPPGA